MTWELLVQWFGSGTAVALVALVREVLRWRKEHHARKVPSVIQQVSKIYAILGELQRGTPAGKVLIVKVQNGGQVPMVGSELTGSVVYEVTKDLPPTVSRWHHQLLDRAYIDLMRDVYQHKSLWLHTDQMPDCLLKHLYMADGIAKSHVHYLHATEGAFFALSIAFPQKGYGLASNALYLDTVRSAVSELQKIFKTIPV